MAATPQPELTPEQYLDLERRAETKHEYVDGFAYAMAGASFAHVTIATNLLVSIGSGLKGSPCQPLGNDMRVAVPIEGLFAYPDLTVVCGRPEFVDGAFDTLLNPTVIVEVLSPTTERWDRGEKFKRYRAIPSLQEYVLVSQTGAVVEVFARKGANWLLSVSEGMESAFRLESLGFSIPLAEVFDRVEFSEDEPPPERGT